MPAGTGNYFRDQRKWFFSAKAGDWLVRLNCKSFTCENPFNVNARIGFGRQRARENALESMSVEGLEFFQRSEIPSAGAGFGLRTMSCAGIGRVGR